MTIYSLYPKDGKEPEEPEILIEEEANWQRQNWQSQIQPQRPGSVRRAFNWIGIRILIVMGLVLAFCWMAICILLMALRAVRYLIHWKRTEAKRGVTKAWSFFLMGAMAVVGGLVALWKIQAGISWLVKRLMGGWAGQSSFVGSPLSIHPLFYKIFARF